MGKRQLWILLPFFKVGGVEKWAIAAKYELNSAYAVRVLSFGPVDRRATEIFHGALVERVTFIDLLKIILVEGAPDVCLCALTPANLIGGLLFIVSRTKVITSVHLTLKRESARSNFHYFRRRALYWLIGLLSNKVIAVSEGVACDAVELAKISPSKVIAVYNPCFDSVPILNKSKKRIGYVRFAAAGRLDYQKGFDMLIDAFNGFASHRRDVKPTLTIFGDGEYRERLASQVRELSIPNVEFAGNIEHLGQTLSNFDVFVLSSRFEGFGNVLAEALAAGNRCIAFSCAHGPSEILANGRFGVLVEPGSVEGLSAAMEEQLELSWRISGDRAQCLERHLYQFSREHFGNRLRDLLI